VPQGAAIGESQFRQRIRHVILDRVDADSTPLGNLATGQAVFHSMHHPPFGGRENVIV
jgi:hypothetical protein